MSILPQRKTAIYIRVSTKEQQAEGYGLEAQRSQLLTYVENHPLQNLVTKPEWVFTDVQTGSEYLRPQLQKLIGLAKKGEIDTVLIYKIDRLSRTLKDLLEIAEILQKHQVSLISMQENIDFSGPIGNLIFQVFGAIAQFERELIKSRTRMGIIASAEMGNFTGTAIPYGYKAIKNDSGKGKHLAFESATAKVVKQIYQWYNFDDLGDLGISKKLNAAGNTRTKTKKWTVGAIRNILTNSLYRGEYVASKRGEHGQILPSDQWTIVTIPAIIDDLTFQLAQAKRIQRRDGRKQGENVYLLSGKIVDRSQPEGKKFVGKPRSKGGRSYVRRSYTDSKDQYIPSFVIPAKPIEDETWDTLMKALDKPEVFIKNFLSRADHLDAGKQQIQQELDQIREARINTEFQISRIEKAYEEDIYTLEKMTEKVEVLQTTINELDQKHRELSERLLSLHNQAQTIQDIRDTAQKFHYALDNLDDKQKQTLVNLFVDRVEINRHPKAKSSKGRILWEKTVEVFFRINPRLLLENQEVGTTSPGTGDVDREDFSVGKSQLGGQPTSRYNLIPVKFLLKYGAVDTKNGKRCGGAILVKPPK